MSTVPSLCWFIEQDAHQLVGAGETPRRATQMRPKAVGGGIFDPFSNVDNFRPDIFSDVMSGVVIEPTGLKVRVKFVDSW